jgi:hypothetical protein
MYIGVCTTFGGLVGMPTDSLVCAETSPGDVSNAETIPAASADRGKC